MKSSDKKAFSLAEMMVVMLVVSIVLVALTPIITKHLRSTKGTGITMADIDKEIDDKLKNYYTKAEVNNLLSNYYTKTEIDSKIKGINDAFSNYYTKTEIDNKFNNLINNLPASPDLSNYVTKTQVNDAIYRSMPYGTIVAYDTDNGIPDGWHECDGYAGTPDLRGRFIRGLDSSRTLGSYQDSDNKAHHHKLRGGDHAGDFKGLIQWGGVGLITGQNASALDYYDNLATGWQCMTDSGSTDAHPQNIAIHYIMKISKANYF